MFIDTGYESGLALQRSAMFPVTNIPDQLSSAPTERGRSFRVASYKHYVPTGRLVWLEKPCKKNMKVRSVWFP